MNKTHYFAFGTIFGAVLIAFIVWISSINKPEPITQEEIEKLFNEPNPYPLKNRYEKYCDKTPGDQLRCQCLERGNVSCLTHVIFHVPKEYENGTHEIPMTMLGHEICYDVYKDPLNYRGEVDALFEKHNGDVNKVLEDIYLTVSDEDGVVVRFKYDNVSEVVEEKIYNGTKIGCLKAKPRHNQMYGLPG